MNYYYPISNGQSLIITCLHPHFADPPVMKNPFLTILYPIYPIHPMIHPRKETVLHGSIIIPSKPGSFLIAIAINELLNESNYT